MASDEVSVDGSPHWDRTHEQGLCAEGTEGSEGQGEGRMEGAELATFRAVTLPGCTSGSPAGCGVS